MNITQWLAGLGFSGSTLAVVFFLLLIPLGMFLDAIAILLICLPIMWPALHASGVNGIWFGIIMMKVLEIGQITPPVAINIFTMKAVAPHVPLKDIYLGSFIFLAVDMLTVVLLFAFPILSLCLPRYFNL
jgi:TRAP-type C4-dicarboxylate transport system permease large subunit